MPSALAVAGAAVLAHGLSVALIGSAWWVPNWTLIGLVLAVARRPAAWWAVGALCGSALALWTARSGGAVFGAAVGAAGTLAWLGRAWDLTERRLGAATAGGLASGFVLLGAWLDGAWNLRIAGLWLVHTLFTAAGWLMAAWLLEWRSAAAGSTPTGSRATRAGG